MDNFDLKKFLKENNAIENLNPSFAAFNENESREERADVDKYEYEEGKKAGKRETMKAKIKEMVIAELSADAVAAEDYDFLAEEELEEAKKKDTEEELDVEVTDTEEEIPAEEAPSTDGGLKDIAADMEGTEGELMDLLMKAFQISKGMNNEKLETQIGNTLKFFVSEYIGGGDE